MKTFFERFLDEEKAKRWVAEIRMTLQEYAEIHPSAPIVQMPVRH